MTFWNCQFFEKYVACHAKNLNEALQGQKACVMV